MATQGLTRPARTGLQRWHHVAASKDAAELPSLIAEDAVFRSPAVFAPQVGRELVTAYLSAALVVLGPEFHYEREWTGETSAVLEFKTMLGDREVHGVDMIEWDDAGLIRDFTVMVRPLSALTVLIERMAAELGLSGS